MSARLEMLAREKQFLLVRSSLSRLRLRRETRELRATLRFPRIDRFVALAGRVVLCAKLVRSVIGKRSVASA